MNGRSAEAGSRAATAERRHAAPCCALGAPMTKCTRISALTVAFAAPQFQFAPAHRRPLIFQSPPCQRLPDNSFSQERIMSTAADEYLATALHVMECNSLHRDIVLWNELREEASRRALGASSPAETYDAIRWALSQLNDGHSFFAPPECGHAAIRQGQYDREATIPDGFLRSDRIAYLHVPGFRGSPEYETRYIDVLQEFIALLDDAAPIGWIVDLIDNGGGNMWPMLAGLGPLLSEGPLGSFRFPMQPPAIWSYRAGQALLDDVSLAHATKGGYALRHPAKPIALLSNERTASSGEAVLIAFVGRPNTCRFGITTRGLTTANDQFPLPDGATLFLTVGIFADRFGHVYGQALEPDFPCEGSKDIIQSRAAIWICGSN